MGAQPEPVNLTAFIMLSKARSRVRRAMTELEEANRELARAAADVEQLSRRLEANYGVKLEVT